MPSHDVGLLLVDDDPSAIQVMSRMLAQYAHQRFATSGQQALQLAREVTPDLILLDVDMPGMTGLDVCTALRADPKLARVPVIFATSHGAPQLEVAAFDNGATDFVTKPLIAAQLTARVRARLRASCLVKNTNRRLSGSAGLAGHTVAALPRLLIVDDDVVAIRILRRALATMGEIHFATSGEEALRVARRIGPDLILLDNQMPGLDGFAVCETLKAEFAFAQVPIVFTTGFTDPRTERRAFELGAADFIAKPYAPAVVQARVRNLLDLKRRTDTALRLSHVVHEMGNPLNGILGFARLMKGDTTQPLPAGQARRLEHVLTSGQQLHTLLRDLLDMGHLQSGQLSVELRSVSVARSVEDAIAAVSALALEAGITLLCVDVPASIHVLADAVRLQQCLANLLTNAIKYNRPAGWVRVEVNHRHEQVEIAVRDNGLGLDAAQREHLFEPFNRLGRTEVESGTGLGLVITRQLVQAMNGQLGVDSEAAHGSCFTLVLPSAMPSRPVHPAEVH